MNMVDYNYNTEEALAYRMMVASVLATLKMGIGALATTSSYTVMVGSMWGSAI